MYYYKTRSRCPPKDPASRPGRGEKHCERGFSMSTVDRLRCNREAQQIAKRAFAEVARQICPGMTEREIKRRVEMLLVQYGSDSFWRYGIGATIHVGPRTTLSGSTRTYRVTDLAVQPNDCVVMDLAPSRSFYWGDYARTVFLEEGRPITEPEELTIPAFREGLEAEIELHRALRRVARPDMTFAELYWRMSEELRKLGFENLDFSRNLGHSVELDAKNRRFIDENCHQPLSACEAFTFEPHIRRPTGRYGFKREDMYAFGKGGKLEVL